MAAKYYPQIDELDIALAAFVQKMKISTKNSEHLKTCCIRFLTTLSRIHSHDTKDALDRLAAPDCQNEEAIDIIQRFVDPLDCQILYKIVAALEDEQLSKAWGEYCQKSKQACRITLEQCRKVAIRPHRSPPSGITLGIQTKISPPDITIQKILQLKDFLITKVGLEESVFQGFACSAVALFFTISRERLPFLIRLLSCHQKALLDFSIITMFVPGEFFYDVAKDQEYPCPKVCSVTICAYTVWPEILAGNLFWWIGGFESNLPIFQSAKLFTVCLIRDVINMSSTIVQNVRTKSSNFKRMERK